MRIVAFEQNMQGLFLFYFFWLGFSIADILHNNIRL